MERFTICGLRAFVDYVNETLPKTHIIRAVRRASVFTLLVIGF